MSPHVANAHLPVYLILSIYLIYPVLYLPHLPIYLIYPVYHLPHFPFLLAIVFWRENSQFSHPKRVSRPCIFGKLAFLLYQFLFECSTSGLSFLPCFSIEECFSSIQNVIVPAKTSSFCALTTVDLHCTAPYWFHRTHMHPSLSHTIHPSQSHLSQFVCYISSLLYHIVVFHLHLLSPGT